MQIPIIDIFAGPGGLGEGFSAFVNDEGERPFKIALSIEKDHWAHQTLTLRSFFRQFPSKAEVPEEYYQFMRGELTLDQLYSYHATEAELAKREAWKAELGIVPNKEVDKRIQEALDGEKDWVLIGGPPCQAYSMVGRSRRQVTILDESKDHRVGLYKQYLRILAVHNPAIFVMENVKGLLSASTAENQIFTKIKRDLSNPVTAYYEEFGRNGLSIDCPGYRIYSLVKEPKFDLFGNPENDPMDFLVETEKYGIPQTRHRVILLGIRKDIEENPATLEKMDQMVSVAQVFGNLPKIRSGLSRNQDSAEQWKLSIQKVENRGMLTGLDKETKELILQTKERIQNGRLGLGKEFLRVRNLKVGHAPEWYMDERIGGVTHHVSKTHMESDLLRYLFVSAYGKIHGTSPKLDQFPKRLLPAHRNISEDQDFRKFADRFRVQLENEPSKTITSHISKDGHYYIHPDPSQCRSLTVREAARIQTFPDNYFFCGPRSEQFHQVGNAVPPLIANQIASKTFKVFSPMLRIERSDENLKPDYKYEGNYT